MLKHLAIITPKNRTRYSVLERTIELPKVKLMSSREINACYSAWNLSEAPRQLIDADKPAWRQQSATDIAWLDLYVAWRGLALVLMGR